MGRRTTTAMSSFKPQHVKSAKPDQGWDDDIRGRVKWMSLFSAGQSPTGELTAGIAEIEPGDEFKTHRHPQSEIYFITAGSGVVCIDGTDHKANAGDALFVPGNAWHSVRNNGKETLRIFYTFAADAIDDIQYEFRDE